MSPAERMTPQQKKVVDYIAFEGLRDKEIAARMGVQYQTVKKYLAAVRCVLGVNSRLQVAIWRLTNENHRRI